MAPQLDQGSQRRPQAVFFFLLYLLPSLSVSSCYCLGMPQFWHRRSEVTRPQELSSSFSQCTVTMIHHSHGSLSLGPDTAVTHAQVHVNMQSLARGQTHTFITVGSSKALVCLEITALEMIHKNHSLTNTMTQYLLETWFYLTRHVKVKDISKKKSTAFQLSGSTFSFVGQQFTLILSAWHVIIVELIDLLEAAVYLIFFKVTKR